MSEERLILYRVFHAFNPLTLHVTNGPGTAESKVNYFLPSARFITMHLVNMS